MSASLFPLRLRKQIALWIWPEGALQDKAILADDLNIWVGKRRPAWWSDIEIRCFVVSAHREMSIQECVDLGLTRFGPRRMIGKSTIGRCWQRLDKIKAVATVAERRRSAELAS